MINPFNGEGIAYGYETGRLAAVVLGQALTSNDPGSCGSTSSACRRVRPVLPGGPRLRTRYQPAHGDAGVHPDGMQSRSLMEWLLRIMSNMLRPDETGPAEAAYKAVAALARAKPAH